MSLQLFYDDSFSAYDSAHLGARGWSNNTGGSISSGNGRNGNNSLRINNGSIQRLLTLPYVGNDCFITILCAAKVPVQPGGPGISALFYLQTTGFQVGSFVAPDSTISIFTLASGSGFGLRTMQPGVWYQIELAVGFVYNSLSNSTAVQAELFVDSGLSAQAS